jgi:peptidyl-prolyl cis-trans isomerase B (cyclophilin B)
MNKLLPTFEIEMENGEVMAGELYPDMAPNTVNNFIKLANDGFYDGLTIHRIIPGFVLQGGCPVGNGTGGPGYGIKGEFANNGFSDNTLRHTPGVLSMARSMSPDSGGSQFFIMLGTHKHLDGEYAGFGKVTSGYEIAEKLSKTPLRNPNAGMPTEAPIIKKVRVDTKDNEYDKPETL